VKLATLLPLRRLCELAQVSRAGFYRWRQAVTPVADDMELRDDIQCIALEFPYYGWRRVTAELRRRGWTVNHKRVRRIMREDNLLCLRRRKFVVTTDSGHSRPVYPNLAAQLELSGLNQLWIADITYIRLEAEFIYLAVVIDAFSRRGAGPQYRRRLGTGGLACGHGTTGRDHWPGASFRPRQPVRIDRLHEFAQGFENRHQYESQGEPLGKCRL
jgi:transposase InsO family protein